MSKLEPNRELLEALRRSVKQELTASEVENQKISLVMGSLDKNVTVTRIQVREVLKRHGQIYA